MNEKIMNKAFREEFKFYKRKDVPLNLQKVIDFNNSESYYGKLIKSVICSKSTENWEKNFGMKDPSEWEVFEFLNKPGLIFIKNPFLVSSQRYWIIRCLQDFTKKPNKLNIDVHSIIKNNEEWWDVCQRLLRDCETGYGTVLLKKLRWATFGYHHNWDTKEYCESSKSDFPTDLKMLSKFIAEALNFPDFNAEAAIINMYHFGSSLSGHTDHSEINVEAPLLSFSFGQSAVFLIGGTSIDDEALPILLESGDIIIMSGQSRLCYHGVPRILPAQKKPWNIKEKKVCESCDSEYFSKEVTDKLWSEQFWKPFEHYVNKSRINMNVRQVLLPRQKSLDSK